MILVLLATLLLASFADAASLKNVLAVPGAAVDKTQLNGSRGGANVNRLGGFGSDIYYDRFANVFYGLTDRGPGGGTIGYATRVQKFTLDIDPVTGTAGNFNLLATIPFTVPAGKIVNGVAGPAVFNGIDPGFGSPRNASNIGISHDPEGFVVAPNGHFYVSDEYGPSVYEFLPDGMFVRAFRTPENIVPRDAGGLNFSASASVTPSPAVSETEASKDWPSALTASGYSLFSKIHWRMRVPSIQDAQWDALLPADSAGTSASLPIARTREKALPNISISLKV